MGPWHPVYQMVFPLDGGISWYTLVVNIVKTMGRKGEKEDAKVKKRKRDSDGRILTMVGQ